MEFDWTTFALEVLNFLVLVWLLKRFFYRPVLEVIERRRAATAKTMADAEALRHEAEQLKSDYLARLAHVEEARAAASTQLEEEMAAERKRRLAAVAAEADADRQRRQLLEARAQEERAAVLEREAITVAVRFASRFLDRLAGPQLEARLVELALDELGTLTSEKLDALRDAGTDITVSSAHPLDAAQRSAITRALSRLAGRELAPEFALDTTLKAGIRIVAGSWVLMANLRDELAFFGGAASHGG